MVLEMTGSISSNKSSSSSSTSTNLVLDNEIETKKTPMKGQTIESNNNIEQITQSLVQRLQPNEQGKRIRLYRNGDRFFKVFFKFIRL